MITKCIILYFKNIATFFLKKQQIKSFEESEKKEDAKQMYKVQAKQDAQEGKRPHFVNKCKDKI